MDSRLKKLIHACGGQAKVAAATGVKPQSVYLWTVQGRLPFSELTGATRYAEVLEEMQPADATPRLTADEIRHIGLCGANDQTRQRRVAQ